MAGDPERVRVDTAELTFGAPFTRGYAPTEIPAGGRFRPQDLAADALALKAALGGDERAVLVGHDWSAMTTWEVTRRAPAAFARYVAMAVPPGAALLRAPLPVALRQQRLSAYMLVHQIPGIEARARRLIPGLWRAWSPGHDATEDLAHLADALDGPGRMAAALGCYRDTLRTRLRATITQRPGAPALYLDGAEDVNARILDWLA